MTTLTVEEVRQRAIAALDEKYREARAQASDRYWDTTGGNVKSWVARAYSAAASDVRNTPPLDGESALDYVSRVQELVQSHRGNGPDADDEAWFDSAIDDAECVISAALR